MGITIGNLRSMPIFDQTTVVVDRNSVLGNPFNMYHEYMRDGVCDEYERHFNKQLAENPRFKKELDRLARLHAEHGKLTLYCWCAPKRCHAETIRDYILEQAKTQKNTKLAGE